MQKVLIDRCIVIDYIKCISKTEINEISRPCINLLLKWN